MAYHGGAWLAMASHGWPWRALPGHGGPCLAIAGHGQARKHERQQRKHVLFVVISTKTGAVCCQMLIACCLLLVVCFLRFASCESSFFFCKKEALFSSLLKSFRPKDGNFLGVEGCHRPASAEQNLFFAGFGQFCLVVVGFAQAYLDWLMLASLGW